MELGQVGVGLGRRREVRPVYDGTVGESLGEASQVWNG